VSVLYVRLSDSTRPQQRVAEQIRVLTVVEAELELREVRGQMLDGELVVAPHDKRGVKLDAP
jgi:hypothetical protein